MDGYGNGASPSPTSCMTSADDKKYKNQMKPKVKKQAPSRSSKPSKAHQLEPTDPAQVSMQVVVLGYASGRPVSQLNAALWERSSYSISNTTVTAAQSQLLCRTAGTANGHDHAK